MTLFGWRSEEQDNFDKIHKIMEGFGSRLLRLEKMAEKTIGSVEDVAIASAETSNNVSIMNTNVGFIAATVEQTSENVMDIKQKLGK